MKKNLEYGLLETVSVKDETISGFLLKFDAMKSDGAGGYARALIADFNHTSIDVLVQRNGRKDPIVIFTGFLGDFLLGMYAQTTKLDLIYTATTRGYLVNIGFGDSVLSLKGEDQLQVRLKVDAKTFTALVKGESTLSFETMPAIGNTPTLPQVKYYHIGNGEQQISMDLGDRINKIVVATDFTAAYDASVKAKLVDGKLTARNFDKDFTEEQVYAENREMLRVNPETAVEDMVIYWNRAELHNAKLRAKLDAAADKDAKVITLGSVSAH